ncbi:MAG: DUF2339 domain-containing protein, partial [Actinomycetota bacterium]|nr:DUF2339 domain-containing protein [Actinomycetota bacterium]
MTEPHVVIARIRADLAAVTHQLDRVSTDVAELDRMLVQQSGAPAPGWPAPTAPVPPPPPVAPYWSSYPSAGPLPYHPPPAAPPRPAASAPGSQGWIGKLLAVAGVAVTLVGVVLLLVLAAQAGLLRPEFRVGAGAVLAAALVGTGYWLNTRPGGRVGAIALAATGVAAAYIDVIAVTAIYGWVPPPAGLVLAAAVAAVGLTLARRWDTQQLGLLVLVPMIVLAPVVTDGITVLLVGFMLALAAVSLPVQLGRDWVWLHAARIAVAVLPLWVALSARFIDDGSDDLWLAGACAIAALIAIAAGLILLPGTVNRVPMALLTAAGVAPVLAVGVAVDRMPAALMATALAAAMLALALVGGRLPGLTPAVRQVFGAVSAVAALIAVSVGFDGRVAGPLLLAMSVVVAVGAGRTEHGAGVARWAALGFAGVGALAHLAAAPLFTLLEPVKTGAAAGASTLVSSVLLAGAAVAITWSWRSRERAVWLIAGAVVAYCVTSFTVTAGVLIAGDRGGFFAGHMVATICWIALAAALFGYAARLPRPQ